jgi:hypothetical protein
LVAAGFLVVAGWWFIRNKVLYGQFLATKRSEDYLKAFFAATAPWGSHLFFSLLPHVFLQTTWYAQPNLSLPAAANWILGLAALSCLGIGTWRMAQARQDAPTRRTGFLLIACVLAAIAAVAVNIHATTIADARVAFVALSAFSLLIVTGTARIASVLKSSAGQFGLWAWPAVMLMADVYVLARFVVPLGGL